MGPVRYLVRYDPSRGLLFALVLAACHAPSDGTCVDAPFTVRDSAGVVMATTGECDARRPVGWVVETHPEPELGGDGRGEASEYFRIQGARQLANGVLAVLDGGDREVRFFGEEGGFLFSLGREGRGPGEFLDPQVMGFHPPGPDHDSMGLLVYDRRLGRFTWASIDRSYRMVSPVFSQDVGRVVGWVGGKLLTRHVAGVSVVGVPGVHSDPGPEAFLLMDPGTGEARVVAEVAVPGSFEHVFAGMGHAEFLPFEVPIRQAVGRERLYVVGEKRPEVWEFDGEGALRRILRVDARTRVATGEDLEAFTRMRVRTTTSPEAAAHWGAVYRDTPWRREIPAFDEIQVDDGGFVWARLYSIDPGAFRQWVVFGQEGRALGTVEVPAELRVEQFGHGFVLGVWRDSLNVEHVRRHALRRAASQVEDSTSPPSPPTP
jgi:hypothetical protein